jgi:hypothetical protein
MEETQTACSQGGCDIFDIYKVAIAGSADLFPVLNELRSYCNDDSDDCLSRSIREFNFYRTQLTGMANELGMLRKPERMHKTTIPL